MSLLGYAERMERMGVDATPEPEHPQFIAAGRRVEWRSGNPRLSVHRGSVGRWRKGGSQGLLVFCFDCPIRTRAAKHKTTEQIDADILAWKLWHTRVARTQLLIIKEEARQLMEMQESLQKVRDLLAVQGANGNWNYSPYMCGLYNGLELARSILEDGGVTPPAFRERPVDGWLMNRPARDFAAVQEAMDPAAEETADVPRIMLDAIAAGEDES